MGGAEGGADRQFAAPLLELGELQLRDVDTRQQQEQRDGREETDQHWLRLADDLSPQGNQQRAKCTLPLGNEPLFDPLDPVEIGAAGLQRHTRAQAPDQCEVGIGHPCRG